MVYDYSIRHAPGDLTEDEAIAIADATVLSVYGAAISDEYTYETTANYADSLLYCVVYRRYVWGIPSLDSIQIAMNLKGEVISINARYLGMFSDAQECIEKESIDAAVSQLHSTYSTWTFTTTMLTVDQNGDYYIFATMYRSNPDALEGVDLMEVYINVI